MKNKNTTDSDLHIKLIQRAEYANTFWALSKAQRDAYQIPNVQGKYIILSDVHKGDGNASTDDFIHNDALYCKALEYYLENDYRLILNGDIEECWKSPYEAILETYRHSAFFMERQFAAKGEEYYLRTYGNHDDDWADPAKVNRVLAPALGRPIKVYPAIQLGSHMLIAHGHQGDVTGDLIARVSRNVVRRIWRPLQQRFDWDLNTLLLTNYSSFQSRRDRFLHQWAVKYRQLIIAGHTHRALFQPSNTDHYMNLGACVHKGGFTGIEIEGDEIRLIGWRAMETLERTVFGLANLNQILARI